MPDFKKLLLKQLPSLSLCTVLLSSQVLAANSNVLTADVRVTVTPANLQETLPIPGASRQVNMAFHGVAVQDALRALAKQGGFNVLIDESVSGSVNVDLHNVSIQDALETLRTAGNLSYWVDGKNLMVADADSDIGKSYQKTATRIIPLHNANAKMIADILNKTIFANRVQAGGGTGTAQSMPVVPDYNTNSLLVVGSPTDIKTAMEHVEALDQPRQMKTWRLSQANVLDVATFLSSSLFNEGQPVFMVSGGSSGGSTGNTGANGQNGQTGVMPSTLRVTADNIAEGTGATQSSQSGSSSGGGSGSGQSVVNSMTIRARAKSSQTAQISPNGPILIPDTRLNTLTLLGTSEQIAMAEALIPTLDRKVPQLVLEASLVEISETGRKELGSSAGSNSRITSFGSNNSPTAPALVNQGFSNPIGLATNAQTPYESLFQITGRPITRAKDFMFQVNALISKNKAKVLANPTIVTASDNEAVISIVDELIKSVTVTQGFGLQPTVTDNIGEAGIVLNILPRVGPDGMVSLRVRPVVSSIAGTQVDRFNNLITLVSKREVLTQNTVLHDGETFVLGGLINNTNTKTVYSNPFLSQLPIVGALARNTIDNKNRTELVVLITPHIVNDTPQVAHTISGNMKSQIAPIINDKNADAFVPVSLDASGGGSGATNVLPPMENVSVLGGNSQPQPTQSFQPAPKPSSNAFTRLYSSDDSSLRMPSIAGKGVPSNVNDISDETIQNIMNKFK